jgi:hypothetical protein
VLGMLLKCLSRLCKHPLAGGNQTVLQ